MTFSISLQTMMGSIVNSKELNDQSKDMYEDYQRRFAEDPFNEDTVRVGDALLDKISEAQRSKWKEMIESTDFTHSSRKAWNQSTSSQKTTQNLSSNVKSLSPRRLTNYF